MTNHRWSTHDVRQISALEQIYAERHQTFETEAALEKELLAGLTPEQVAIYERLSDQTGAVWSLEMEAVLQTVASHFPGFREAILCIADAARGVEGGCAVCRDDQSARMLARSLKS